MWRLSDDGVTSAGQPATASHEKTTSSIEPPIRQRHHRPSTRYCTTYECSVCDSVREVETSASHRCVRRREHPLWSSCSPQLLISKLEQFGDIVGHYLVKGRD